MSKRANSPEFGFLVFFAGWLITVIGAIWVSEGWEILYVAGGFAACFMLGVECQARLAAAKERALS